MARDAHAGGRNTKTESSVAFNAIGREPRSDAQPAVGAQYPLAIVAQAVGRRGQKNGGDYFQAANVDERRDYIGQLERIDDGRCRRGVQIERRRRSRSAGAILTARAAVRIAMLTIFAAMMLVIRRRLLCLASSKIVVARNRPLTLAAAVGRLRDSSFQKNSLQHPLGYSIHRAAASARADQCQRDKQAGCCFGDHGERLDGGVIVVTRCQF